MIYHYHCTGGSSMQHFPYLSNVDKQIQVLPCCMPRIIENTHDNLIIVLCPQPIIMHVMWWSITSELNMKA